MSIHHFTGSLLLLIKLTANNDAIKWLAEGDMTETAEGDRLTLAK